MEPLRPSRLRRSTSALLLAACLAVPSLATAPAWAQFIPAPFGTDLLPDGMTREDVDIVTATSAKLYGNDGATVGTTEAWSNPKSGNRGTMTLTRMFQHDGMPCRQVTHKIRISGRNEQTYTFNRCKVATGEWKLLG